jgi:hypothetical protein
VVLLTASAKTSQAGVVNSGNHSGPTRDSVYAHSLVQWHPTSCARTGPVIPSHARVCSCLTCSVAQQIAAHTTGCETRNRTSNLRVMGPTGLPEPPTRGLLRNQPGTGCEPGISVLDGPMLLSNRKSLAASHRNSWSVRTARTRRPFLHVARAFPAGFYSGVSPCSYFARHACKAPACCDQSKSSQNTLAWMQPLGAAIPSADRTRVIVERLKPGRSARF